MLGERFSPRQAADARGAAAIPCIYLALLVLMRELGRADLDILRKVARRQKA